MKDKIIASVLADQVNYNGKMPVIPNPRLKMGTGVIYFIGIGGIGMSSIAQILSYAGYKVCGSDSGSSYITERLVSLGIDVKIGQDPNNIPADTDLVIYSTAIKADNCELISCEDRGIRAIHRAEALALLLSSYSNAIGVTGAHGKTTTTAMLATVLFSCNGSPTVINGGLLNRFESNAIFGTGDIIVTEADESDGSFLLLPLRSAIMTNIDKEHLENYQHSYDELQKAYEQVICKLPDNGFLVYCCDDRILGSIVDGLREGHIPKLRAAACSYGLLPESDVQIIEYNANGGGTSFRLKFSNRMLTDIKKSVARSDLANSSNVTDTYIENDYVNHSFFIPTYGLHNVLNMTAAISMALLSGYRDIDMIAQGVESFAGVKRRFTLLGEFHGMDVVDDYAHHPAEIKAVLEMARLTLNNKPETSEYISRIITIFQPHRYSRLFALMDEFAEELSKSDLLIISDVYGAGEDKIEGGDAKTLIAKCKDYGCNAMYLENRSDLGELLPKVGREGDILLFMGAGDITNWARDIAVT